MTQKQLGRRIYSLREGLEMSQEALADYLGITRQAVGQIEKGERKVDSLELMKLASFFSMPLGDMLQAETKKSNEPLQQSKLIDYCFDRERLRHLLLYVLEKCGGKPNLGETVLYKLLYFIDFEAVEILGRPLTGMSYVKLQYGPVPRKCEYESVTKEMTEKGELKIFSHEFYGKPQKRYVALREPNIEVFTKTEEALINRNLNQLSDMKAGEITHYVHGDIPWKKTPDGEVINYGLAFQRELPYSRIDYGLLQESASAQDILKQLGPLSKDEAEYYENL